MLVSPTVLGSFNVLVYTVESELFIIWATQFKIEFYIDNYSTMPCILYKRCDDEREKKEKRSDLRPTLQRVLCWARRWGWTGSNGRSSYGGQTCRLSLSGLHTTRPSCTYLLCTPTSTYTPPSNCLYTGTTTCRG